MEKKIILPEKLHNEVAAGHNHFRINDDLNEDDIKLPPKERTWHATPLILTHYIHVIILIVLGNDTNSRLTFSSLKIVAYAVIQSRLPIPSLTDSTKIQVNFKTSPT